MMTTLTATSNSVRSIMQTQLRIVSPELTLPELERRFLTDRVSGYPVVDHGRLVGIVSRSDIVRQLTVENSLSAMVAQAALEVDGLSDSLDDPYAQVAARVGQRIDQLHVRDVMIRQVITVTPEATLEEAAQLLMRHRFHRLIVVENQRPVGIVTSLDFVRLIANGRVVVQ